jgi:uncharacterized caspase-like protein
MPFSAVAFQCLAMACFRLGLSVMPGILRFIVALFALIAPDLVAAQNVSPAERRIALVIGNVSYQAGALNTPANDAGLIAQTLQAAGFDVVGARDLDQDSLRRAFRDFLEKAQTSEPNTVAFVYLSGYGLQLEGENYFVPIDAKIARDSDVAAEAVRISDYTRPLAALNLKASIVVLDTARANPFAKTGEPLAGGLALVEPGHGMLIAFNAAPGTVAPEWEGPYGPYAQALAEMMRDGGLSLADIFDRARLRVNDVTRGAEVPWYTSQVQAPFVFFERAPDAPPPAVSNEQTAAILSKPIRDLGSSEAYIAALERDTLQSYMDFLDAYPNDPMARRVRAIVAARREAITWHRSRLADAPAAYWSYLRRYPYGPHAADARRRLAFLTAPLEPPSSFTMFPYDVPPPPPEEIVYFERPVLVFDDPVFELAPPPPLPLIFLQPPPPEFVVLPPPPPPTDVFVLPIPVYTPVPIWVRPPAYVAPPPPNNVIFSNIHNTVVIDNTTNAVTIRDPNGHTMTVAPPAQPAAPAARTPMGAPIPAAAVVGPALPPSIAQKAITIQSQAPQGPGAQPNAPAQPQAQQPVQPQMQRPGGPPPQQTGQPPQQGQPLPGMKGQPLPPAQGAAPTGAQPGQPQMQRPGGPPPQQQHQQIEQQRQQQIQQQHQQIEQQRQQQIEQQRQQQIEQQRQQQIQQQQQQRQQQIEQQRQQQIEQQRQQQIQQQQQQRQQQIEQQRQQQIEQQRQQQIQQQQQQQRQQQIEQQRQQQIEQQRQQQIQQQQQQRQQQIEQQRQQQIEQQKNCGAPGQPPCPK